MPIAEAETRLDRAFLPAGVRVNADCQRKNWRAAFTQLMVAQRLGEMNADQAVAFVDDFVECGIPANELIEPLEAAIDVVTGAKAILETGLARLLIAAGAAPE